ncbi:hypothetical protein FOA52_001841 [Chlamydomonas sp. UWO 241]|nr:hypothetical protein FOA52_001841 [Chlamydomonas sp. UWO 241]
MDGPALSRTAPPSTAASMASTGKISLSEKLARAKAAIMKNTLENDPTPFVASPNPFDPKKGGLAATGRPLSSGRAAGIRASAPAAAVSGPGAKPRGFCCYLCGCQFGSQSLMIHVAACQKKWNATEAAKDPKARRALPPPPPEMRALPEGKLPTEMGEVDRFNSAMYAYWDKVSLMPCAICTRTFRPDAFESHAKVCTRDNPGGPLGLPKGAPPGGARPAGPPGAAAAGPSRQAPPGAGPPRQGPPLPQGAAPAGPRAPPPPGGAVLGGAQRAAPASRSDGQKPRAYCCYLCGCQFGSQSLFIHIASCRKKWVAVEDSKPPRERRALPPAPPSLTEDLPKDGPGMDAFNSAMSDYWSKISLRKCHICTRTFRDEAYAHHAKVCTSENPGGPLGLPKGVTQAGTAPAARGGVGGIDSKPRGYMCYLCGQQYGSTSLAIHVPQCYEKWMLVTPPRSAAWAPPLPAALAHRVRVVLLDPLRLAAGA